ncbi:TKL protein kinase [Aphanomyces invadans]|uniref:TKL protein kinase n=1 Tax=Aphanomyces invadans TaxID=157072 RepID=A0A024UC49_9STRA|nr:TKL protein kinase [Aphanomyces invadans]ETW03844.1 TKL protein kinase [Aphanomyces invadans]RHY32354.1 hypothetical protein DYB32_002688 [Aphanomyces invadans]|eukprot:XP_008868073.1 TKL protein kinase [Aphanomyces invadans]
MGCLPSKHRQPQYVHVPDGSFRPAPVTPRQNFTSGGANGTRMGGGTNGSRPGINNGSTAPRTTTRTTTNGTTSRTAGRSLRAPGERVVGGSAPIKILDDVNCGEYVELEQFKHDYWLDPNDIVHTRTVQSNYMKTELGHYLGQPVLIKSLNFSASAEDLAKNKKALVSEVRSMTRIQHPNIVKFLGFYITEDHGLCCISEYMEGKTLRHLLNNKRQNLTWAKEKIAIAMDIASALVYMHSLNPRLIHRNIKAEKVLLTNRREAKLSGFGCARDRTFENTMTAGVGDIQWSAPELLQDGEDYDEKVDVYSFGVVLTELDTREIPFANEMAVMARADITMKLVTGMLRPAVSADCPPCIKKIVHQCLQHDASLRPTSERVLQLLRDARLQLLEIK